MRLLTIQKREKLNEVFSVGDIGPGNAYHHYVIETPNRKLVGDIKFQCGPRKDENSINGVIDTDLLEIARDRLMSFQGGPYFSYENQNALTHIEEALMWLNRRVEDRIERNVLGTNKK